MIVDRMGIIIINYLHSRCFSRFGGSQTKTGETEQSESPAIF